MADKPGVPQDTPVIHNGLLYYVAYVGTTVADWKMYIGAVDITNGLHKYGPSEILFPLLDKTLVSASQSTFQRPGLLIANNLLYVGFAYFLTDLSNYSGPEGFIYGYALDDLSHPQHSFQTTVAKNGGIWRRQRTSGR